MCQYRRVGGGWTREAGLTCRVGAPRRADAVTEEDGHQYKDCGFEHAWSPHNANCRKHVYVNRRPRYQTDSQAGLTPRR